MRLEDHPLYPRLHDRQLALAEMLVAEQPLCEALPFRLDGKIGEALVAAAETLYSGPEIIVVGCDEDTAAAWADLWRSRGRLEVEGKLRAGPSPCPVQIATIADLSWCEEEHRARSYGLCIIAGLDDAQSGYVLQAVRAGHFWRSVFVDEEFDADVWKVGPCGQALRDGFVWERAHVPGALLRPSALAERALT